MTKDKPFLRRSNWRKKPRTPCAMPKGWRVRWPVVGTIYVDKYELGRIHNGFASPSSLRYRAEFCFRFKPAVEAVDAVVADEGIVKLARRKTIGGRIYQVKITLKGIRPPIWRRVQAPGEKSVMHGHPALVGVFLTDGKVRYVPGRKEGRHYGYGRAGITL
jgi:hypothetical protein